MNKTTTLSLSSAVLLASTISVVPQAAAFEVDVSGFIRQEMAYKLNNNENQTNRGGSKFNGVNSYSEGKLTNAFGIPTGTLLNTKRDQSKNNDWNVFATKAELDFNMTFSDSVTGFVKLRGYYQPDVYKSVEPTYLDIDGRQNVDAGHVNHFNVNHHGKEATYLSISDNNYMADIPAMYLDWQKGPLWVRAGQQQIAWGEALFFRVADLANGLDLRRHVFFDLGAEEYADERMSAPGVRVSYQINNSWEIEGFAQMFQPSILPNNFSPFNLITNGFKMNFEDGYDLVDDKVNAGFRLQGQSLGKDGSWGIQAFAVTRHDPNPILALEASGVPNAAFGPGFETQPFIYEKGGIGTYSAEEWFYNSAMLGADGVDVINGLVEDWDWIKGFVEGGLGWSPDGNGDYITSVADPGGPNGFNGNDFVELFFANGAGGGADQLDAINGGNSLSGVVKVRYASENVFGFGVNKIFYAEPDTFMDQLVVRAELAYTPNKKFSNNLRQKFREENELLVSVVAEKYHRFSNSFPATFFIFEHMWRKESDLLGRHLSGLGGRTGKRPGGGEDDRGWHGTVLAFQQPFPGLIWRADMSFLYDWEKGYLFQPAVRYKPSNEWTVEAFLNIIDGEKDTAFQPFDWSDDFTMRITYQF